MSVLVLTIGLLIKEIVSLQSLENYIEFGTRTKCSFLTAIRTFGKSGGREMLGKQKKRQATKKRCLK